MTTDNEQMQRIEDLTSNILQLMEETKKVESIESKIVDKITQYQTKKIEEEVNLYYRRLKLKYTALLVATAVYLFAACAIATSKLDYTGATSNLVPFSYFALSILLCVLIGIPIILHFQKGSATFNKKILKDFDEYKETILKTG